MCVQIKFYTVSFLPGEEEIGRKKLKDDGIRKEEREKKKAQKEKKGGGAVADRK